VAIDGAAHEQVFSVECQVEGLSESFEGSGDSKKEAEQSAAERALLVLGEGK
jgi:ribonuclease-3